jgi:REP element-mobilizing transposase RayT
MKKPGQAALRKGRVSLPNAVYHVVTTTYRRQPHFHDFALARVTVRTLYQARGGTVLAHALMPDHLHWLVRLDDGVLADQCTGCQEHQRETDQQAAWTPRVRLGFRFF